MVSDNSKLAYKEIIKNGYIGYKEKLVLECIMNNPNISDYEIATNIEEKINCVTPRRYDLESYGLIEHSGYVFNKITERKSKCYSVVRNIDILEFKKQKELLFVICKSRKHKKNYIYYKNVEKGCCKYLQEIDKKKSKLFQKYIKSGSKKSWKSWLMKKIFNEEVFKK